MAMCTYLNDLEFVKFSEVEDKELNEIFQEVRVKFSNEYFIQEHLFIEKRWMKKPIEKRFYTLYKLLITPEVQVINFHSDGPSSINTGVTKSLLMATFFGLLNGYNYAINSTKIKV